VTAVSADRHPYGKLEGRRARRPIVAALSATTFTDLITITRHEWVLRCDESDHDDAHP